MKNLARQLVISLIATITLGVLVSGLYPLVVWGVAQAVFPGKANGSLVEKDGKVVGSALLGQTFVAPKYFHSRPSAAGKGYDATSSGGTNLGPTSQKLIDGVKKAAADYRTENGLAAGVLVPVDAVTSSASGLDPHISPQNAMLQVARIARERGLAEDAVRHAVAQHTDGPDLGVFGEPGVNVLLLNLALDRGLAAD